MDEELRLHVELATERNLAAGMSPAEARRAARLAFGPAEAIAEAARAQRRWAWVGDLGRDLRYAARTLRGSPGFTAVVVLTLALGVGAAVAIVSVVDGVLLRPLPYPAAERLVALQETNPPWFPEYVRPRSWIEWRRQARSFERLSIVRARAYNLTDAGGAAHVSAARVTASTFATLGVRPALGRDFWPDEDEPGRGQVVILSHGFWQRRFGGRPDVLHRSLRLDGRPFTVVGVMPEGFELDQPLDLFTPAGYTENDAEVRRSLGAHGVRAIGRLRPGVTALQAERELLVIADRLARQQGEADEGWSVKVTPLLEARVGAARPMLLSLLGAVGILLLLACANVANLLLARSTARRREMSLRAALGAGRGRLARQLLAESLLLALTGGALGALGARLGVGALLLVAPEGLPRAAEIGVDARALGVALALTLVTSVAFGLGPALAAARARAGDAPFANARGADVDGRQGRVRAGLVVLEIAAALVLLCGAGLLMRSFAGLHAAERGFRPEDALSFEVSLPPHAYRGPAAISGLAERAARRLSALPGVEAVGASQALPFSVDMNVAAYEVAGRPPPPALQIAHVFQVTPGYLRAMGIPLLRGRTIDERDAANAPRVCVVNEAMARRHFPDEDPIGKRLHPPGRPGEGGEIVGVVADVKDGRISPLGAGVAMQLYISLAQNPYEVLTFVVRARAGAGDLSAAIRAAMAEVDPDLPLARMRPLGDWVAASMARQRFALVLFAAFSGAALLLAALGLYGIVSYAVARRTGELAIRVALGARRADVLRLVLGQAAKLVALGLALGVAGALALTRLLASLLFGVRPHDPATFAVVVALLSLVALLACLLPALRATRVDPMAALRAE
jgi:putative ABC transport system permease protein